MNPIELIELLHESQNSRVYLASMRGSEEQLILKQSKLADKSSLYNEAALMKQLEHALSTTPEITTFDSRPVLVRRFLKGISLRDHLESFGHGLNLFLEWALPLAHALDDLHKNGIIHKDISPDNIIIDSETGKATLIDLESGAPLLNTGIVFDSRRSVEGSLPYLSPELTGRMNRQVDYRSDYYSLGAVYYEMLCGSTMFETQDELEMIHAHIAVFPVPVHEQNGDIPASFWQVIKKLIAKNGEDRYQSIAGITGDIIQLIKLRDTGYQDELIAGIHDISPRLNLVQRIIGRDYEISLIKTLYHKTSRGGKIVLGLKGNSGIGKTSLIRETGKMLSETGGLFISGKFDAMHRSIPYFAWSQMLNELAGLLLSEDQQFVNRSRDIFTANMQGLEDVVIAIAPRWKNFFLEARGLNLLNPKEQQNRVQHGISRFIATLQKIFDPLLLFLDDWQWADEASVDLFDSICRDPKLKGLFLVVAWRDNEVDAGHVFIKAINEIKAKQSEAGADPNMEISELSLKPLKLSDTEEFLSLSFPRRRQDLFEFSTLIHDRTNGNPFFINQLLDFLFNKNQIRMNLSTGQWEWDLEAIRSFRWGSDISGLVVAKIRETSSENLKVLTHAACLGHAFSFNALKAIFDEREEQLHTLLWNAYRDNLIECLTPGYKFVPDFYSAQDIDLQFRFTHDRIQQALYHLSDDELRADLHYRCAVFDLTRETAPEEVFTIANHIVMSVDKIIQSEYILQAREKILQAARRAFNSGAHESAFFFLSEYRKLNGIENPLSNEVYCMMIESAFLSSQNSIVEPLIKEAMGRAIEKLERAAVFNSIIKGNTALNKHKEAVAVAREALEELDFKLPRKKTSLLQVIISSIKTQVALPEKKIAMIADNPLMEDRESSVKMELALNALPAFFFADNATYPLVIFKMVRESIRKGNSPASIVAYGSYGLILAGLLKKPAAGYELAKQATALIPRLGAHQLNATVGFINGMFIKHLKEPLHAFEQGIYQSYEQGLQAGDLYYASWNLYTHAWIKLFRGTDIREHIENFKSVELFCRRYNQLHAIDQCTGTLEMLYRIAEKKTPSLSDNEKEKEIRLNLSKEKNDVLEFLMNMSKGYLGVLNLKFEEALPYLKANEKLYTAIAGNYYERFSRMLLGIVKLNLAMEGKLNARAVKKETEKTIRNLSGHEKLFEGNVSWITLILKAEIETLKTGKPNASSYLKAAEKARAYKYEFPAVIIELMFLRKLISGRDQYIKPFWQKLRENLDQLDMKSVIASWEEKFPEIQNDPGFNKHSSTARGEVNTDKLDAKTILKSAEVLSGEIALDKLSSRMLSFALENAGADYGSFYAYQNGEFRQLAELHADNANMRSRTGIPESVKNLVMRTSEELLLDDASSRTPFERDEMIRSNQEKSVLCIPILQHQQCIGLIYLGNRHLKGAFTEDRITIIKMLAGQMAISLQNAILFNDMEKQVANRTEQLIAEKSKSDSLLLNILPKEIAAELKEKGHAIPRHYESATVMFCDIQNFTSAAQKMNAADLIQELDTCFKAFDEIIIRHGMEKIKTIGDAYLCAAGIPSYTPDHAVRAVRAALEIQEWMLNRYDQNTLNNKPAFRLRIGMHCGPLVAGVVGNLKFAYDIWGDTVNMASRMEQNGEVDKVNISEEMHVMVSDLFDCKYRGEIEVKNKGKQKMYFVMT